MKGFANMRHAVHREQPRQKEWAIVYSGLVQPGDAFVFYDGETTLTRDGWIEFAYYPMTCNSWEKLWSELAAYPFAYSMKSRLCPDDCRLLYAEIIPWFPTPHSAPYLKLLREMKAEAMGRQFYARRLEARTAGKVVCHLKKNRESVKISVDLQGCRLGL